MKAWLGVLGRGFLEFFIILLLLGFSAGVSARLDAGSASGLALPRQALHAAMELLPLALAAALFLCFFSFDARVRSRLAAWLGLLLIGAVALGGQQLLRHSGLATSLFGPTAAAHAGGRLGGDIALQPPGIGLADKGLVLWYESAVGTALTNFVALDFRAEFPRLRHAPRADYDKAAGLVRAEGRDYAMPAARFAAPRFEEGLPISVSGLASLSGFWIWQRLATPASAPLLASLAAAFGFLLFICGFRFLTRFSAWPLANAALAFLCLAALIGLDALIAKAAAGPRLAAMALSLGLRLSPPMLVAALEGAVGLVLGLLSIIPDKARGYR